MGLLKVIKNETTSPIFKGLELPKRKKKPMIIMFDFKISITIKKGGSGRAVEEYSDKSTNILAELLESRKNLNDNYIRF